MCVCVRVHVCVRARLCVSVRYFLFEAVTSKKKIGKIFLWLRVQYKC